MKKLLLALAVSLAMTSGAQALETSVKPQVTDLGVQPQSYMLVGNSFTFYSSGLHNIINRLAKADGMKIRRNRMVTIGGADLGWFNVWDLCRPTGQASTYVDHSDGIRLSSLISRKKRFSTPSFFRTTARDRLILSARTSFSELCSSTRRI